jgi:hydrogenase maturation factor HypF (carbamoyltransferase family)
LPLIRVQHHAAHASALAGEHPDIEKWLVFTWDGVGYGSDGALWGGEALAGKPGGWNRVASFRPFRLVGGDKAGREPWRSAAALMWAVGAGHARDKKSAAWRPPTHNPVGAGHARDKKSAAWRPPTHNPVGAGHARDKKSAAWRPPTHIPVGAGHARDEKSAAWRPPTHIPVGADSSANHFVGKKSRLNQLPQSQLLHQAWERRINTFETSAAGRLFDAAAALVLGRNLASFEGQGPMELEAIAADDCVAVSLPLLEDELGVLRSDWAPLLDVLGDHDLPQDQRAGIFHETMARALLDQTLRARDCAAFDAVGLSGGVFQNRRLTERVVELLTERGIEVRLHREIPANDGGLCFGQIIEAMAMM